MLEGYAIESRLPDSSYGERYVARASDGRPAVVEILHPAYCEDVTRVARFADEARAVARLAHPSVAELREIGMAGDRYFHAIAHVPGRPLRALLGRRQTIDAALALLAPIAEALDAVHAIGIAHRDLSPDHVLVGAGGSVVLVGFGRSRLVDDEVLLGDVRYRAPEQCRGRSSGVPSDVYAFGALAFHAFTGRAPFEGDDLEIALHHLNDGAAPPSRYRPGLPPAVDATCLSLLAKLPADRPRPLARAVDAFAAAVPRRVG